MSIHMTVHQLQERFLNKLVPLSGCVGMTILLGACQASTSMPSSLDPEISPSPLPYTDMGFFFRLKCSEIQDELVRIDLGPTWNDLTIGSSTFRQVETKLSSEGIERDATDAYLRFTTQLPLMESPWLEIQACFVDGLLTVMQVDGAPDLHLTLEEWMRLYGKPDRVTWADDYYYRSVIWAEEGTLIFVNYLNSAAWDVILFPPMPSEELASSWVMAGLPRELTGKPGDVQPVPPPVEDPWGIEQ